jgi:hypothetical protein
LKERIVQAFLKSPRRWVAAGVVTASLVLVAACACIHAQSVEAPTPPPARAPATSDAELAARVKAALRADSYVNDMHIEVVIENGNVVLTGLVEDNRALLDALEIARKAAEGRKVIDAMSIMKISRH